MPLLIPGTLGFTVTTNGRVFSPTGKEQKYYRNTDNYRTVAVMMMDGNWVTFGVHRLVALAHLECPGDPSEYTVNHRDRDIHNNRTSNLEWVTVKLNNVHASLTSDKSERPKIIAVMPTGRMTFLYNLVEASEAIGCTPLDVWDAIKNSEEINGWKVMHHASGDPIPKELWNPRIPIRGMDGRAPITPVKVKDMMTGEVESFETLNDAARKFGKSASHLFQCISRGGYPRLFLRQYLIVKAKDPFPEYSIEDFVDSTGKDVLAFNRTDKTFYTFRSANVFIMSAKISRKAVTTRLRKGFLSKTIQEYGDWVFSYDADGVEAKMVAYLKRPGS